MMKYLFVAFVSALIAAAVADEISDCNCWPGYKAQKLAHSEEVQCVGIVLLHIMPCNLPKRPSCKCGPGVTGILTDDSGTWCSTYADGKELKRWACENEEEWAEFYKKYPDEKPNASS